MKRFSLLPNVITAFGLSCGLFVIYKVMLADSSQSLFGLLQAASILLLIAAFADVADGAIARLIKAESDFGGEFDSLSDSVTFGVAPPLLILKVMSTSNLSRIFTLLLIIAAMIYTLCGVLRLVRYNLKRKIKQPELPKFKRYFIGLPIPAAAGIVVSSCLMMISPWGEIYFPLTPAGQALLMFSVMIVIGYFMVSRWKFPSLSALYFRVPTFNLVIAIGVFVVLILYGVLDYFPIVLFVVFWSYLICSWLLAIYRLITGRNVTAAIEPEPQDEEEEHDIEIK